MLRHRIAPLRAPRHALLGVLLVVLVLVAGLTYQAQDADRSHRATAQQHLQRSARAAAEGVALRVKDEVALTFGVAIRALVDANRGTDGRATGSRPPGPAAARPVRFPTPALTDAASAEALSRGFEHVRLGSVNYYFVFDSAGHTLHASTDSLTEDYRRWLGDTVVAQIRAARQPPGQAGVILASRVGRERLIGYLAHAEPGGDSLIYGVETSPAELVPVFQAVLRASSFAKTLLLRPLPNDSVIHVLARAPEGVRLFTADGESLPDYTATANTGTQFGSISLEVALRPAAPAYLLVGGVPPSRLPLLLALLALTAALIGLALRQIRREQELARLRADFVSSVSHELRTPLAQIRLFAETLLLGRFRFESERRRCLEIIDQEARRLTQLVENVLQFSRAERHVVRVAPERVELNSQLREIVDSFRPLAESRRALVRLDAEDGVVAHVDRNALRQIVLNLLDNAVKYGPPAQTILVGLGLFGEVARIWVDDEGPGIAPAAREKIFEAFYRSPDRPRSAMGSGIGLALVRELVTTHGGRVWAEEAPGGGARIVVELPGARLAAGEAPPAQAGVA